MSQHPQARVVGLFVVVSVLLLVFAIVLFSSGPLISHTRDFVVYFDGSVAGLSIGAPVKFRGVQIGVVKEVLLAMEGEDRASTDFRIPVVFDLDEDRIQRRGSSFDIHDDFLVDSLIDLGMRAQLATESFVTGRKFIALDIYPNTAVDLSSEGTVRGLREMPSVEGDFAVLQARATELIGTLAEVDLDAIIASIEGTIDGIYQFVTSPELHGFVDSLQIVAGNLNETLATIRNVASDLDTTLVPLRSHVASIALRADSTMGAAEAAIANLSATFAPGSPLLTKLERTLDELSETSRALRALAQLLERNPSALLRGTETPKEEKP